MVRTFLAKLALLFVPFLVVLGVPATVMWRAGEFDSPASVAARQMQSPDTLYLTAYSNGWQRLKSLSTAVRKPDVVAVGTSRVMQFRAGFFKDPASFYNAGGAIYEAPQFRDFLRNIGY